MNSLNHSKRLRAKIRLAEPYLLDVSDQFWTHPQLAEMFPEFLFMMHSIIRSSVSLINAAAVSAQRRADLDPVCQKIVSYYTTHALEEAHHDDWLLEDIVAMGAVSYTHLSPLTPINFFGLWLHARTKTETTNRSCQSLRALLSI